MVFDISRVGPTVVVVMQPNRNLIVLVITETIRFRFGKWWNLKSSCTAVKDLGFVLLSFFTSALAPSWTLAINISFLLRFCDLNPWPCFAQPPSLKFGHLSPRGSTPGGGHRLRGSSLAFCSHPHDPSAGYWATT